MRRALHVLLIGLPALAAAQAPVRPAPAADSADIDTVLFLIGDAGDPEPGGEPVLEALSRDVARDPGRSFVVFLGDNVYLHGLGAPDDPSRREMERRLDTQVEAVKSAGGRGVFIPGNHDWGGAEGEAREGWESVRREQRRVDERGAPLVSFFPKDGCPGPDVQDVGEELRLVFLDSQWWLRSKGPKPVSPTSTCAAASPEEILAALKSALVTAGARRVVVAAHHPLRSGGPHGGYFSFRQHVFPLTEAKKWLWVPLPIIGSIYPLSRQNGGTPQDASGALNQAMRKAFESAFQEHPPWVYAAGHEHALQVLQGESARHLLVSGAGIYSHESGVRAIEGTRYASSEAGYMRLDVTRDGRARLGVVEVDKKGKAREAYSEWLAP